MIKIYPSEQLLLNKESSSIFLKKIDNCGPESLFDILESEYSFCKSGRDGIQKIVLHLNLQRHDEIFISTTTESNYVSTCVSATLFNFCSISRVLTSRTKAIFVIHTFCFPNPRLSELRKLADELNIPLIEDCISAFDSFDVSSIRLGSVGDFAIYSLPKMIPVKYGGVITSRKSNIIYQDDQYLRGEVNKWIPKLWFLKQQRRKYYDLLRESFGAEIYTLSEEINPYMYSFYSPIAEKVISNSSCVEFGVTHIPSEVNIPLNPFATTDEYLGAIKCIRGLM